MSNPKICMFFFYPLLICQHFGYNANTRNLVFIKNYFKKLNIMEQIAIIVVELIHLIATR